MPEKDPQDNQHRELVEQIAALTERVHKLEQLAGHRQAPANRPLPVPDALPPYQSRSGASPERINTAQDELESKIGAHWLNRVGIVAVLIGASYFLKYAFDNQWIGPAGRVLTGLLSGLGAMFWSEYVRRKGYAVFSYSLQALGVGLLYLSLWASSQVYGLVSMSMAFGAMMSVTAATVALALWQNAQVVASFALIGGFITPIVLSTGENKAVSLFSYIALMDVGALLLFRYRPWIRILTGSLIGTLILYSAWHNQFFTTEQVTVAALAVSTFFVIFVVAPFLSPLKHDSPGLLLLVLANAAIYFVEIYDFFDHTESTRLAAIVATGLGGVYLVLGHILSRAGPVNIANVHRIVGTSLLITAVPIGLEAHWITIGWFALAGGIVWASRRPQNDFLKYFGAAALGFGVFRLILLDRFDVTRLVLNERMMTFAVAVAVLVLVARFVANAGKDDERVALAVLIVTINVLALAALNQEITSAWRRQIEISDATAQRTLRIARDFAYSALWMSYGACLMVAGFWKQTRFLRWQALILIAVTIGKVFLYDTASLDRGYRILNLIALGVILLATSFLYQRNWFKLHER